MNQKAGGPTLIAIAVVEDNGRFLIGQRPAGVALAGLWEFPGGKVELGESPEKAAIRECLEETGLSIEIRGAYPRQIHQYKHDHVQLHFLACRPIASDAIPRPPFRWVERNELRRYEFPAANRELLDLLTDRCATLHIGASRIRPE